MNENNWPLPIVPMNTNGIAGRNKVVVGQVFGRLQVVEMLNESTRVSNKVCKCVCSCGNHTTPYTNNLNTGNTRSCGCLRVDTTRKRSTTHGHSRVTGASKTYWIWAEMVARCTNQKHADFKYYGGRGIQVCDAWLKFEAFLNDMGEKPKGMTLDRIDNNKGYEPGNCRWATQAEQCRNTRSNVLNWDMVREIRASDLMYKELAEKLGVSIKSVAEAKRNQTWFDPEYTPTDRRKGKKANG